MGKLPVFVNDQQARSAGELTHSHLSADQAGAGIGQALAGLGGAVGNVGAILDARESARKQTDANIAIANVTGQAAVQMTDLAANAPPDG